MKYIMKPQLNSRKDLTFGDFSGVWSKSQDVHKEPIMGSHVLPYHESGMRGSEPLPVVGFLHKNTKVLAT